MSEEVEEGAGAEEGVAMLKAAMTPSLPDLAAILFDKSLYEVMPVTMGDRDTLEKLRSGNFQIDAFCINCQIKMVFNTGRSSGGGATGGRSMVSRPNELDMIYINGSFTCSITCARCKSVYTYYFRKIENGLVKVGQYPSLEDIGCADIIKFRKILRPEDYAEIRRATGLFSHGIGIGSFVYLRRIFERLIDAHHVELEDTGTPIAGFAGKRMEDKIAYLAAVLPPAVVENKNVYGILSVGIHELDEDTCRLYFPFVRAAIIEILEQDLAARERKAASENTRAALAEIERQLKAKGPVAKAGTKA